MKMRLSPTYQLHLKDWTKSLIIVYGILVGIFLLSMIFIAVSSDDGGFTGMEFVSQIFLFVSGIVVFKPNLKLALANGISRRTEYVSTLLAALTVAVICMILNNGVNILYGFLYKTTSEFYVTYNGFDFSNPAAYYLTKVLYDILSNFSGFVAGYFVGSLYYRMNRPLRVAVSIGVPVLLISGTGVVGFLVARSEFFAKLFAWILEKAVIIYANPYTAMLATLIVSALIGMFAFLLIRTAPIKEQG